MKNPRGADPDNEIVRAIKKIVDKGAKMTDDDRAAKSRLQFACCLYIDDNGPYVPAANFRRCLIQAARIRRLGTAVERAVIPYSEKIALIYDGPRDADGLWVCEQPQFRYSTMVNANPSQGKKKSMVPSMRPRFLKWGFEAEWELVTTAMNFDDFRSVVEAAGLVEGLGDNRVNGLGRFVAKVEAA
jgi:hypothetical protein